MKKLALIIATLTLAATATGCQNWTGGKSNCCKSKCCSKQKCGHAKNTCCNKAPAKQCK